MTEQRVRELENKVGRLTAERDSEKSRANEFRRKAKLALAEAQEFAKQSAALEVENARLLTTCTMWEEYFDDDNAEARIAENEELATRCAELEAELGRLKQERQKQLEEARAAVAQIIEERKERGDHVIEMQFLSFVRDACRFLPDGYLLEVTFSRGEMSVELTGPDGGEIEIDSPTDDAGDVGLCQDAINTACRLEGAPEVYAPALIDRRRAFISPF